MLSISFFGTFSSFLKVSYAAIFCIRTFGTRDIQIFAKIVDFG